MGTLLKIIGAMAVAAWGFTSLVSCNTSGCTDNRSAIPLAQFCSSSTLKDITLDSIEIHGVGAPGDSILVAAGQSVSSVYLPMRPEANSTTWCLSYRWPDLDDPALNDTITFKYDAEPWFAPDDCGAMYRYRITGMSYTTHLVDSVAILDSLISNIDQTSVNIYFRTGEPDRSDNSPSTITL